MHQDPCPVSVVGIQGGAAHRAHNTSGAEPLLRLVFFCIYLLLFLSLIIFVLQQLVFFSNLYKKRLLYEKYAKNTIVEYEICVAASAVTGDVIEVQYSLSQHCINTTTKKSGRTS